VQPPAWSQQARNVERARRWLDHVSQQCDTAIGRLRAFVEDER
jgi:hypothetical protein